jgi:hypothetical protein
MFLCPRMSDLDTSEPQIEQEVLKAKQTEISEVAENTEVAQNAEMETEVETPPPADGPISPPDMFADDFQKTLENSPEWQEMERSLKATLAQFKDEQTKDVVDVPLIKGTVENNLINESV